MTDATAETQTCPFCYTELDARATVCGQCGAVKDLTPAWMSRLKFYGLSVGLILVGLVLAGALASVGAYVVGVLDAYQVARFTAFLDPRADPQGVGYNVEQALIAIGTGGVRGQGLLDGVHTQGAFVPYQYTDFIFSAIGEELGMIGGLAVIALFVLLLLRGVAAATQADRFGALLATGIVCWFAAQGFENLGMNLGLLPVTGVPLPFVSYGGSSVIAAWIGVGLLLRVSRH